VVFTSICNDVTDRLPAPECRTDAVEEFATDPHLQRRWPLMAIPPTVSDVAFLLGRVLFGVVIGYLALGNLQNLASSVSYAQSKGAPLASITVPLGSLGLIAGALAVLVGVYPSLGVLAIVTFLVPITVIMHDFWTMEGQARQNEQIHFLKNVGLIGAALLFLALSTSAWPLAVGVGL
jgi:putative oxidoreductase